MNRLAVSPNDCSGCGLPEGHKKCPAHGTDIYMNPDHECYGNAADIAYAQQRRAEAAERQLATANAVIAELEKRLRTSPDTAVASLAEAHAALDELGIPQAAGRQCYHERCNCHITHRIRTMADQLAAANAAKPQVIVGDGSPLPEGNWLARNIDSRRWVSIIYFAGATTFAGYRYLRLPDTLADKGGDDGSHS